ncbi:hypothetical protein F5884DRAFT_712563 [Xylogone sp. PMI_703]|nr:hypothetical protein F5884DRAFT_712563 [Xylogone sp. PMI_703]
MSSILTVVGATGAQGKSVAESALRNGTYKVRAITRNVHSSNAKHLASQGAELVVADLNDEESLAKAFAGSTAIFAVTNFFEPFASGGPDKAIQVELAQGKNIANAASKTDTLQHFIWSTLPGISEISNGKHKVPHFDAKREIDGYIKGIPTLLSKTTFVWVGFYAQNYGFPMFSPNFLKSAQKYVQLQPVVATTPVVCIGDVGKNVGIFISVILKQPQLTHGKYVLASVEHTTIGRMLELWSEVTGKPSVYVQTDSMETFDSVWPMWGREMGVMMRYFEEFGENSWSGEQVLTSKELGIKDKFVGIRETYEAMDWSSY